MTVTWVEPKVEVQKFVAQEYASMACYKIKCTTPNGNASYNYLYDDTNKNGQWDKNDELLQSNPILGFSGCGNWHDGVMRDEPPTANGFVTKGPFTSLFNATPVFWWKESFNDGSSDYHVMTPGSENYETNPNAS